MGGNRNTANLVEEIRTTKTKLVFTSEAIITAHATFASLISSSLSLSEQLDGKFKELELREAAVQQWENEVKEKSQKVEEREKICVEREKNLEDREKRVDAKESQWMEKEKKMQQNAEQLPTVIQMNVSGKRFAAPKDILLKHKGSLFEQMMTSNHSQQLPTGEIFIGRDPKYFQHVFNFLLDGQLPAISNEKLLNIENEFHHFHIPFELPLIPSTQENMIDKGMFSPIIRSWLPKKKFHLLYKASRDGFASTDFHRLCDNKGPTLTVIRSSEGYLFGGFTPLHWDCSVSDKYDTKSFIFTLTNPHNIPPTKYPHNQQKNKRAIWCSPSYGPCFGAGCDIDIHANPDKTNASWTFFPDSYVDSTGKGKQTFTGNYIFTANEIEVFSVL